jgi:excisionase family DNA binding protein
MSEIEQVFEAIANRVFDRRKDELLQSRPEPAKLSLVEPLVSVAQAAKHLDISERKLRQMVADRKIPFRRIDGSVKFKLSELDDWSVAA